VRDGWLESRPKVNAECWGLLVGCMLFSAATFFSIKDALLLKRYKYYIRPQHN
jgi:hypothetical protein